MQKISIITVNLNNRDGLEKTIKSVISQRYTNYEFIVIDGASVDGSLDVIEKYKEYIFYNISEPDNGIYNGMNKGIKEATGDYYHFLNSGDIYASDIVLEDIFKENKYESFVCGNFFFSYSGNLVKYDFYKVRDWSFSLYEIFADGLCHQAFFISKEMFQKYGYYDESLRIASDFKLFFIAIGINQESVKYIDVDVVIYDTDGFSSNVGGIAILGEKKLIAKGELSQHVYKRMEHLQYLERNGYITEFVLSKKWIHTLFKVFNKICITLKLTKVEY